MNQMHVDGSHPDWLTQGKNLFDLERPHMGPHKRIRPSNYRSIICLYQ